MNSFKFLGHLSYSVCAANFQRLFFVRIQFAARDESVSSIIVLSRLVALGRNIL